MKPTSYHRLLSRAYLHTTRAPRSLRYILSLSYLGITIGALSLMLALIITRGFERDISQKMKSINSDAIIRSPGNQLDTSSLKKHIAKTMGRFVAGMSGSSARYLMMERDDSFNVILMRGITPADEVRTTCLQDKMVTPRSLSLSHILASPNSILIGQSLAMQYQLCCGDKITVYVPEKEHGSSLGLEKHSVTVSGIFSIGIDEYDSHTGYCSQETMRTLCPDVKGADQIAISFAPRPQPSLRLAWWQAPRAWLSYLTETTTEYIERQVYKLRLLLHSIQVRSWQELYPDLVASLTLEKYAMTIVLGLIALVASMLMICLLFMFIQYKQHDIALLRALGASERDIYQLFRRLGMMIVLRASLTGLTLAAGIGWWLETYRPIQLPNIYIVSYLPAALEPTSFIIIFVTTMVLGWLACRIPLKQLRNLSVAQLLRES